MVKTNYSEFANLCTKIISDPSRLSSLTPFLTSHDSVILLSIFKVFKNIIPLYKLKIKEDKVQHKQSYIKLHSHEKTLYLLYKKYVDRINKSKRPCSFQIACMIVHELDHFNFAEKMINKVLNGTKNNAVREMCVNAIVKKVKEDTNADTTFKIFLALMDFNLCDHVYECIKQSNVIDKLTMDDFNEKKIEKKEKTTKMLMKNKFGRGVEKSGLKSRMDKKQDILTNKINANLLIEKERKQEEEKISIKRKIVDNIMRIYFMILSDKKESLYKFCFYGLARYKRFIKNTHLDGLMIMLNDIFKETSYENRIIACDCVIKIFGDEKFEFRNLLDVLFDLLVPFKYSFNLTEKKMIVEIVQFLFIKNKQSMNTVLIFMQRFMQFTLLCYLPALEHQIKQIINFHRLDIYDLEIVRNGAYNPECNKLEFVYNHPLYLGSLFMQSKYNINKEQS